MLNMNLNTFLRCNKYGLRLINAISLSSVSIIYFAFILMGCQINREKYVITIVDSVVVFDNQYKQKLIRNLHDGYLDFPDTAYENLSTIKGLENSIRFVINNDSNAVMKLRIDDTLPYAFWRLFVSSSKAGGAHSIDISNKNGLQNYRVKFDQCKTDLSRSNKLNQMMLRFRLWKDSILFDSAVVGQEKICICPPPTIRPVQSKKFISSDSAKRFEYIHKLFNNRHNDIPVYFSFDPRISLAEVSKIMIPMVSSICMQSNSRECYFNDLDYLIENPNNKLQLNAN